VSNLITRPVPAHGSDRVEHFLAVRKLTEQLAAPLSAEDQTVQSMPDASPTKWHRAHTTWFFEQFLLVPHAAGYRVFEEDFAFLFNSYYVAAGPRHGRPQRGMITRPDVSRVAAFRAHVDEAVERLLANAGDTQLSEVLRILEIGLHHEQQHQELLLTDILHAFAQNPLAPAYDWYSFNVLPRVGKLVAGDAESYRYLAESIRVHPKQEALQQMMEQAGFDRVEYFNLAAGVVAVHVGRVY